MLVIKTDGLLGEVKPLIVSSCMRLLGKEISPQQIEDCMTKDKFGNLGVWDIADVVNYSCAVDFLHTLGKAKCREITGQISIALCNYLLRKIGVEESWLADGIDPGLLASRMDKIYKKAGKESSPFRAARFVLEEIYKTKFITSDIEAFVYLLVIFYLNSFGKQVIVFDDNEPVSDSLSVSDRIDVYYGQLLEHLLQETSE
jgi:hypothetical protein